MGPCPQLSASHRQQGWFSQLSSSYPRAVGHSRPQNHPLERLGSGFWFAVKVWATNHISQHLFSHLQNRVHRSYRKEE